MRNNFSYHLRHLYGDGEQLVDQLNDSKESLKGVKTKQKSAKAQLKANEPKKVEIPLEFNGKDYLSYLISIDAELEHSLMLQYLYAAYSLGGPDVPQEHQDTVRCWQEVILGIAKEEMGHFVSVQNVLKLIGAPLHFDRQDFPTDVPFYPFPFKLEPLTKESLAKYVYAESPVGWIDTPIVGNPAAEKARQEIAKIIGELPLVGPPISVLFETVLNLVEDTKALPDDVFQSDTYPFQAKFNEWGRGYRGGSRGNSYGDGVHMPGTPDVLVEPLSSRDDAFNALTAISEQGEDAKPDAMPPSHFERFLAVYIQLSAADYPFARNLAINPYIASGFSQLDCKETKRNENTFRDKVTDPLAVLWSHLLNIRYRMLLMFINHSFVLDDGFNQSGAFAPRGTIINGAFGEMYNLRSISHVLVTLPIAEGSDIFAGPGFELPYTLDLPNGERNRWLFHRDLLEASARVNQKILDETKCPKQRDYLHSLKEADQNLLAIIESLVA